MPLQYGDTVVLIKKSHDGSVSRVNATVLASVVQPDGAETFNPKEAELKRVLKNAQGKPLPGGEYLDLAFPAALPNGQTSTTTRSMENIFRPAYTVAPWAEGVWIGWEASDAGAKKTVADMNKGIAILRAQLAETTEARDKALQALADAGATKEATKKKG